MTLDLELSHNNFYSEQSKTLSCGWNHGFFSNCTVTLWGLVDCYNRNKTPERIDFSHAFSRYRTQEQIDNKTDLYPFYFRTDLNKSIRTGEPIVKHDHHGVYKHYDFDSYNPFIQRYFNVNDSILDIQSRLIKKYNINLEKTVAVCYRGTDKFVEVKLSDPRNYVACAENLLRLIPGARILIQTDQKQVRDLFTSYFGNHCFYLEEMPVNEGNLAVHNILKQLQISAFDFGKMVLATTYLLSRCGVVVNHTGNVAAWICLFRGNAESIMQFDKEGNAILPTSAA